MNGLRLIVVCAALGQQVSGQDLDAVLVRADKLLEDAKASYEEARSKSSVSAFVDAGFKLEDARIKYLVLQEIGSPEKQKIAADRMRAVNQLAKLIHDGKVAISGSPADSKPVEQPSQPPTPGESPKSVVPVRVDVSKRLPVPDAAKLKDAEKLIRDLFKEQYAKKAQSDRKALARTLLAEIPQNRTDEAALWVLCREAQDQAVQGCDVPTAMKAIDATAEIFDVDGMALRNAALAATAKSAKTPEECAGVVTASFKSLDELVANDQYDAADKLATSMLPMAKRAGNVVLYTQMNGRTKDIADAKALYQGMKGVLETLAKTPDDSAGNGEMGKFLCFVKGNWDLGLRFIAKGPDGPIRALAEKELALPTDTAEQVALADGWLDLAEKEKSALRKSQLIARSRFYYEAALAASTGLTRAKIEKRLEGMPSGTGKAAGSGAPAIDLLKLIDLKRDLVMGDWTADGKTLLCNRIQHSSRVQLPYEPPDEYDLTIVAERKEGNAPIFIGLAHGNNQFIIAIDDWGGTVTGLGNIDGRNLKDGETAVSGRLLTNDKPATIVCSLRKTEITLTIDGNRIFGFKAGYERLSNQPNLVVPNRRALFVGCGVSRFLITKMGVTPVSGQGKVLK